MTPSALFGALLAGYGAVIVTVFVIVQGVKWAKWLVENS